MASSEFRRTSPCSPQTPLHADYEDALVREWDRDILRAVRRRARCAADAEELAQEARIRLVMAARRLGENPPKEYLRKVIKNAVLAATFRLRRQGAAYALEGGDLAAPTVRCSDPHVATSVARWVNELAPRLQDLYRVLYVDQKSQREAAIVLGVSQPRVAQLHHELLTQGRVALRRLEHAA
jgi:RNA polymerase sigma factor (sigma-70 family)